MPPATWRSAGRRGSGATTPSLSAAPRSTSRLFVGVGLWVRPEITAETLLIRAFGTLALAAAARRPRDRAAGAARPPLPAAAVEPAPPRRHDVPASRWRTAASRLFQFHALGDRNPLVEPADQQPALGEPGAVPVPAAGRRGAGHPLPDGGDQPRLLAGESHGAGLEDAAHGGLPRLRAARRRTSRSACCRTPRAPLAGGAASAPGSRRSCALHLAAAWKGRAARPRARRDAGADGFVEACGVERDPRRPGAHRHGRRRTGGGLPLRRQALGGLERLPAPERPAGRGQDPRRLHHLPLARLPVPARHGASPAPFTERVPTFRLRLSTALGSSSIRGRSPPGTFVEPVAFDEPFAEKAKAR